MSKMNIGVNREACTDDEQYKYLCDLVENAETKIEDDRIVWIDAMRKLGAKVGIENNGWVDRERHEFYMAGKPIFNDGFGMGDIVAFRHILSSQYFLAEITGKRNGTMITAEWIYWQYKIITLVHSIEEIKEIS